MFQESSYTDKTFLQKVRSFDFTLIICILSLGIISSFSMYSTDGGELLYHSKSHILRFGIFFSLMIALSFLNIRFCFSAFALPWLFHGLQLFHRWNLPYRHNLKPFH